MKTKILLIDDDLICNMANERMMRNMGLAIETKSFIDPTQALEFLEKGTEQYDLILLDINMPRLNGWEFLEELGRNSQFVNVYMYSSSIDPEDVKRARAYPMVREFLSKPLDMNTIRHLLDVPLIRSKVS